MPNYLLYGGLQLKFTNVYLATLNFILKTGLLK